MDHRRAVDREDSLSAFLFFKTYLPAKADNFIQIGLGVKMVMHIDSHER